MRGRDQLVTVQRFDESARDALNEPVGAWVAFCQVWAARRDQGDAEATTAGATGSVTTARFVVRDNSKTRGILPAMRLWDGMRAWNIKQVLQHAHAGRRDLIDLVAVADSGGGAG